ATGTTALGNGWDGVWISQARGNAIGGRSALGASVGNVISGNGRSGVRIEAFSDPSAALDNVVSDNLIGTKADGSAVLGNSEDGVVIDHASGNHIGLGNVIACNRRP